MVMEAVQEDMGEGSMLCTDHPYKNNTPGGICAFCLQEKLGKLVSSSFPSSIFPSSSSSPSPSFRSDYGGTSTAAAAASTLSLSLPPNTTTNNEFQYHQSNSRRAIISFLLTQKKKKEFGRKPEEKAIVFQRSKSTTTPRRRVNLTDDFSPRKRGFWSFLYLSKHSGSRKIGENCKETMSAASMGASASSFRQRSTRERKKREEFVVVDESESPDDSAIDRKVSRSRSVGCGSRSFSGDFFERISTGFGDCTLRRVESQREGKPKVTPLHHRHGGGDCIKERVRCGGIFSGFMIASSSSSSSSSSYWVSSSTEDSNVKAPPSTAAAATPSAAVHLAHGRSKSWGWAFASPIRAFSKPSSTHKREGSSKNNATPNLSAIPSLLAVRG